MNVLVAGRWLGLIALVMHGGVAQARGIYQQPDEFVREAFDGNPPKPQLLWLTPPMQAEAARILGHDLAVRRVRYWRVNTRSAWILEEIGKEEPITTGFVIEDNRIKLVKVLIYRESRGDEVRHAPFTRQFRDARLTAGNELDRSIDVISGASLSVSALTRLARLALYLHAQTGP